METKGWSFLHILLNKYGHRLTSDAFNEAFTHNLPEEEWKICQSLKIFSSDPTSTLFLEERALHDTHFSWLLPTFQQLSKQWQKIYLACLAPHQIPPLAKALDIDITAISYPKPLQKFLVRKLSHHFPKSKDLPCEYEEETPLTPLINLSKKQLVELISLLGIYDITDAVKKIVDNKRLQSIYGSLSSFQLKYLRQCLHHKEKIVARPLDLSEWGGEAKALQKIIQLRGMARLARALSGQPRSLVEKITHILDTGRGTILNNQVAEREVPHITASLTQQVLNTLNYLKKKGKM